MFSKLKELFPVIINVSVHVPSKPTPAPAPKPASMSGTLKFSNARGEGYIVPDDRRYIKPGVYTLYLR